MIKTSERYRPLENEPTSSTNVTIHEPAVIPISTRPVSIFSFDPTVSITNHHYKELSLVQLAASILIVILGIVNIALAAARYDYWACYSVIGTEIWVGILGIIAAGLCLGAIRSQNPDRVHLWISHFVMCIVSSFALGLLIDRTVRCVSVVVTPHILEENAMMRVFLAIEIFIIFASVMNIIANIFTCVFLGRYWSVRFGGAVPAAVPTVIPSGPPQ